VRAIASVKVTPHLSFVHVCLVASVNQVIAGSRETKSQIRSLACRAFHFGRLDGHGYALEQACISSGGLAANLAVAFHEQCGCAPRCLTAEGRDQCMAKSSYLRSRLTLTARIPSWSTTSSTRELRQLIEGVRRLPQEDEGAGFRKARADPQRIGLYISGPANVASLHNRSCGYLIGGIEDGTDDIVATTFNPSASKAVNVNRE
jgi:hypothetical protein